MQEFPYRVICDLDALTFDKLRMMSEKEGISMRSMFIFCVDEYFHSHFRAFEGVFSDPDGGDDRG